MPDRRTEESRPAGASGVATGGHESARSQELQGGYPGGGPEYGRGYGRDFGGGEGQGFDGSWGRGYGGSLAPADYREGFTPGALGAGLEGRDDAQTFGGRDDLAGSHDRSWIDVCADDEASGRSHHRGRGPRDWSREDRQIYEAVCERLLRDPLLDARGMSVEVQDGVVSLIGEARHTSDPALARLLASEVAGVRGVRTDLVVRPAPPEPPRPVQLNPFGHPIEPR